MPFIHAPQENLGGLILSPFNSHRNAGKIHRVGADPAQITNAVAMELAAGGPQRAAHVDANNKLIARSNGLLARLNGEERFVTLGASHTAAFCKVAPLGGPTPEKCLQDAKGNIDLGKNHQEQKLQAYDRSRLDLGDYSR